MNRIIKLFICLFIAALNFNLILKPFNIVSGGTNGLALILQGIIHIKPAIIILIINMMMFLLCLVFLDNKTTNVIVLSTFIYPLFVRITSVFGNIIIFKENVILIAISGIISGLTVGNILKMGYSTGGINILVLILKKVFSIKEYISNFVINMIIIVSGLYLFGIIKAIYGICIITINSIFIKYVNRCKIIL